MIVKINQSQQSFPTRQSGFDTETCRLSFWLNKPDFAQQSWRTVTPGTWQLWSNQLILYRLLLHRKFCWTKETTGWWPTRRIFRSETGWTRERLETIHLARVDWCVNQWCFLCRCKMRESRRRSTSSTTATTAKEDLRRPPQTLLITRSMTWDGFGDD